MIFSITIPLIFFTMAMYPPLTDNPDNAEWGSQVQRTMGLLSESTPDNRQRVKILFYGQSIVGGQWHTWVERDLRERFPYADLTVENRALGGFSSQYLIKTVEHDLLVSKPDLVIFHVYGDHIRYEEIIHTLRQQTAAEVMILTDHWKRNSYKDGEYTFDNWSKFYDRFLPAVSKKYACELVDVRWPWKAYLESNQLEPSDLLRDNVHLNEHGCWLMAQLTLRQLIVRPELETDISKNLTTTYVIGKDLHWQDRTLEFEFSGSRVDLLRQHAGGASCLVTIDGQAPSTFPGTNLHSRSTSIAEPYEWPEIARIGFREIPEPQIWTLTIEEILDPDKQAIAFRLEGDRSGFDGRGTSTEDFISNSGQVTIAADDWILTRKGAAFNEGLIQTGMSIRWRSFRLADDIYFPNGLLERERPVVHTIVDGLPNTHHTLRLETDGIAPPFTHIRVYQPMLPETPFTPMGLTPNTSFDLNDISAPTPRD